MHHRFFYSKRNAYNCLFFKKVHRRDHNTTCLLCLTPYNSNESPKRGSKLHYIQETARMWSKQHTIRKFLPVRKYRECYLLSCSHQFHKYCLEVLEKNSGDQAGRQLCPICKITYFKRLVRK